jgi:hypothetical protein
MNILFYNFRIDFILKFDIVILWYNIDYYIQILFILIIA